MTTATPEAEQRLRELLLAAETRIAGLSDDRSRIVAASDTSNADDEHDPEGATIAYERELLASLLAAARHDREEVLAALDRVADGSYGTCQVCHRMIGDERLAARPAARLCIACSL